MFTSRIVVIDTLLVLLTAGFLLGVILIFTLKNDCEGKDSIQVRYFKLSQESGVLKTEWDALDNMEHCGDMAYELTSGVDHWETTNTSLEIQFSNYTGFIPCTIANFSIVPIIDGERGYELTDSYEIPLPDTFGAKFKHRSGVVPGGGNYFVRMKWELGDIGLCPIEYVVSCYRDDTPAIEEQINTPSYDFKSCPLLGRTHGNITVTIRPVLPGVSPDIDMDGQARICEFYAFPPSWFLTGDCKLLNIEQEVST